MEEETTQKRNPGGRPNLADEEARTYRLVTRVNESDYRYLQLSFSEWRTGKVARFADYLRELILTRSQKSKPKGNGKLDTEQLIDYTQTLHGIRQELKQINTNYNQVAKRINSIEHAGRLYYEVQSSKAMLEKLEPLLTRIDRLVTEGTETLFKK